MFVCAAGQIEISAQNHNYAVDPATLPEDVQVTHINLNDGTCAGLLIPTKKARLPARLRIMQSERNLRPNPNPSPSLRDAACGPAHTHQEMILRRLKTLVMFTLMLITLDSRS